MSAGAIIDFIIPVVVTIVIVVFIRWYFIRRRLLRQMQMQGGTTGPGVPMVVYVPSNQGGNQMQQIQYPPVSAPVASYNPYGPSQYSTQGSGNASSDLDKLEDLRRTGVLTELDYMAAKARLEKRY